MADKRNMLVPAMVSFNLDGKEIEITDYELSISIKNGASHHEFPNQENKSYPCSKGSEISLEGDIKISVIKTPNGELDSAIKALEDANEATKHNDSKEYTKDILFSLCSNDKNPFTNVNVKGYVKEITTESSSGAGFPVCQADIEVFDAAFLKIGK